MTEKFWLVWNPFSCYARVRHGSYGQAKAEAERLANMHPQYSFFVLEGISESRKIQVLTTMLEEELPF